MANKPGGTTPHVCRWGIIGTARIAKKFWRAILQLPDEAKLVAVASRHVERAQSFINDCQSSAPLPSGPPQACGSYDELLAREDIQAVYIPLPTGVRKEWVIKAAERGKHVLMEKPMAMNLADAKEIVAVCRRHDRHLMDGSMFVHSQRMLPLKDTLLDGKSVGRIRRINTQFTFMGDESFFAQDIRTTDALEPLGCLGDLGWYCIKFTLWVQDFHLPVKVRGCVHEKSEDGVPFEVSGEMLFADGVSATFFCSFLVDVSQYAVVSGQKGSVHIKDFVLPVLGSSTSYHILQQSISDDRGAVLVSEMDQKVVVREYSHEKTNSQEVNMVRGFSELCVGGILETRWAEFSLKTQVVLDAVLESARKDGKFVDIHPF